MSQLELLEAYARLKGFKDNVPTTDSIRDNYVNDFHSIIDLLEKITGRNLSGFRVSPDVMYRQYVDWRKGQMTREQYCPRPALMMKVDAVLTFFQFQLQDHKKGPIGFRPSE